jgi:hypothetical protein
MSDMAPVQFPYVIDNVNFGDRFVTMNYCDPVSHNNDIAHFDQLAFPAALFEEDLAEITDLLCVLIDKVQVMRRGPAPRIAARVAPGG